jgi:hydroxymethylbilane synthase
MITAAQTLIAGTRTSNLALWQTDHIIKRLQAVWPGLVCRTRPFLTTGDKSLDKPLPEIGGKGLFTAELEQALRNGDIDIAVHSLKDLPVEDTPGLLLGAVTSRADVGDGLVARHGWTLATLPRGAVVGTGSVRRQAQLRAVRPDLQIRSIRGNVETRLRKVQDGDYDAAILAAAGLRRLGLEAAVTEWLSLDVMLPAPGQGALAVQCRADDVAIRELLAAIDDPAVRMAVTAERTFLASLGGGCAAPIAAYARPTADGLEMRALVASPDGQRVIRVTGVGIDGCTLGMQLARQAQEQGAATLLTASGMVSGPLYGRRIVITRAPHQAKEFGDRLAALGAEPIRIPAIYVVPVPDSARLGQAIHTLSTYDWLVFTSANGVALFGQQPGALATLQSFNHADECSARGPKIAAVGPATAQALAEYGLSADVVPADFVGEAIAEGLGDVNGRRILLLRAEIARQNLPALLAERGAIVDDVPVYRTLPATLSEAELAPLQQGVDVITFTSSSTVRHFMAAIPDPAWLQNVLIACIGPVTAATARELGLIVHIAPKEYTIEGLAQALVDYYQKSSPSIKERER